MACRIRLWCLGAALGLTGLWSWNAAAQEVGPQTPAPQAAAPARQAAHPARITRRIQRSIPGPRAATPAQVNKSDVDKASGTGQGFPGATNAPGTTTERGLNAKPATTGVTLPAGTFDAGNGFTFQFNYTSESAGNVSGGLRLGASYADQILVGADADLGKLAGIKGGAIHFIGTQRDGRSLSNEALGNSLAPQEIFDGSENTRLTVLSYEQKLFNDRLDIEVGRLPGQGAFLVSPIYCNFQNVGVCGSPEIVFSDTNFTFFPTSTWGGHVKVFLTDKLFLHAGAFEVQPSTTLANDHGLNFGLSGATGVIIPVELGYTTTAANDHYPRNYGIGALVDRSSYPDPVTDITGGRALFSHLPVRNQFGRSLVFGRFDQTVYKPDPDSPRGLQIFGVAAGGTGGRQPQDFQLELGAVQTGTFQSRPYDTVGLAVTDQHFSTLGLSNVRAARRSLGLSNAKVASDEILVELNYGIQVHPAIRLTPNLQYIINPDNINVPLRAKIANDAFVFGLKLSVDFFTLAGLAKGPGS